MITWIASYPRSGNTYYLMLLNHFYGIKTYSIYNDPLFEELGASELVGHELLPAPVKKLADENRIYFIKTHDLPIDNNPAIYLVRDGRDALISYANYILSFGKKSHGIQRVRDIINFGKFRKTLRELIADSERYGGWSNNVLSWTHRRGNGSTFVIRYEDLVDDPVKWVRKSLNNLNIQVENGGESIPDFSMLHKKWPKFFRKGKIGSWQQEMPKELLRLFWLHHSEAMKAFGYELTC